MQTWKAEGNKEDWGERLKLKNNPNASGQAKGESRSLSHPIKKSHFFQKWACTVPLLC